MSPSQGYLVSPSFKNLETVNLYRFGTSYGGSSQALVSSVHLFLLHILSKTQLGYPSLLILVITKHYSWSNYYHTSSDAYYGNNTNLVSNGFELLLSLCHSGLHGTSVNSWNPAVSPTSILAL